MLPLGLKLLFFSGLGYAGSFFDLTNWIFATEGDQAAPCRLISLVCYTLISWVGLSVCFSGFCRVKVVASTNGSNPWTLCSAASIVVSAVSLCALQASFIFGLLGNVKLKGMHDD